MAKNKNAIKNAPLRNIMKSVGATIVAKGALDAVAKAVTEKVQNCTVDVTEMNREYGRKKIQKGPLTLALKKHC